MQSDEKISEKMREDWNRRVSHDYRFWMSDGYHSDAEMWETGRRDLAVLLEGISARREKTFLEIGCGVGRLVRAAAEEFGHATGVDVSDAAIQKARTLLSDLSNVSLFVGNGVDLSQFQDRSLDVVVSFAAITSMPTEVIARYLREIHRIVKDGGEIRLQMYLGNPQTVSAQNTLHLRCFERANFETAMLIAGFKIVSIRELVLPFKVSSKEFGIEAVVVEIQKSDQAPGDVTKIANALLPEGELQDEMEGEGGITVVDLEYWMTLNYAKEMAESGDFAKAKAALDYALTQCRGTTINARETLEEIQGLMDKRLASAARAPSGNSTTSERVESTPDEYLTRNLEILTDKFPTIAARLRGAPKSWPGIDVQSSEEGQTIYEEGQCLDHPSKPRASGVAWAKRILQESRVSSAEHLVVFGFGSGYHIEELLRQTHKKVSVIEPRAEVFWQAMQIRDLSDVLNALTSLIVGWEDDLRIFSPETELVVRPQTQVVAGQYCAQVRAKAYGRRGLAALHPKISVLGPMQGGTLPMLPYMVRSLSEIKQRAKPIDVSGFAQGYHVIEDLLVDPTRRATAWNNYCEMISQVVLESYFEKPFDILICLAQAPISGRALSELRKQGVITVLWFVEDYQRFTYWREMSRYYDFVFTIQKGECIDAIKQAGAGEVHYLPPACDPGLHTPLALTEDEKKIWGSPISFVGAGYHNRQQVFASLSHLPFKIWGTEWPTCRPFDKMVQQEGRRLTPGEYIKIFNSTDINLNLHSSSERDGVDPFGDFVNPRTFELAACGAFQLVDERSLLAEMFIPGEEIVTFRTPSEMKEKIQYYLERPEERRKISEAGRKRALRDHTYARRVEQMLELIYSSKFEQIRRREEESGWSKLLSRAEKFPELSERCKRAHQRGEDPNLDGLIADIVTGEGKLTETEQKLLFLYHIRKQTIRMRAEERGEKK